MKKITLMYEFKYRHIPIHQLYYSILFEKTQKNQIVCNYLVFISSSHIIGEYI